MIDVSELMQDPDFASMIEVTRQGAGSYANEGVFTPGASVVSSWPAVVQPANAADITNFLPEGERTNNVIKIYSAQLIQMSDGESVQADTLVWQGASYRVAFSKPWNLHGYYFVLAVGYVPG